VYVHTRPKLNSTLKHNIAYLNYDARCRVAMFIIEPASYREIKTDFPLYYYYYYFVIRFRTFIMRISAYKTPHLKYIYGSRPWFKCFALSIFYNVLLRMYNIITRNGVVDIRFLNVIDRSEKLKLPPCSGCSLQTLFVRFPFKKTTYIFIIIRLYGMLLHIYVRNEAPIRGATYIIGTDSVRYINI